MANNKKPTTNNNLVSIILLITVAVILSYLAITAFWNHKLAGNFQATLEQAQDGDTESQVIVALMYEAGRGVKADTIEASKWYLKAANKGNLKAFLILCSVDEDGNYIYPVTESIKRRLCTINAISK